ncbi:MAG: hypothetical protein R3Y24_15635 [Eubacteriales bacterium]
MKNNLLIKATREVLNIAVKKDFKEWPPTCVGFFHQPAKPRVDDKWKRE